MKGNKRKQSYVKVSYDSGSDGDVESDEDGQREEIPAKKFSMKVPGAKTKRNSGKDSDGGESEQEESGDDFSENEEDASASDDGDSNDDNDDDGDDGEAMKEGGGWADAMASILRKEAPEGGSAVLAKSHDYAKAKEEEKKEFMERVKERQSKKKWENLAKVMPKVTDREFERGLQRIATKGVVQLFNAVQKQQKTRQEKMKEVGGSQRKRAKVEASLTKGAFLDLLKGTPAPSRTDSETKTSEAKKTSGEQPSWGVLRDDFMLGAGMKDWDKDDGSDGEDESEGSEDADSGLSSDSD